MTASAMLRANSESVTSEMPAEEIPVAEIEQGGRLERTKTRLLAAATKLFADEGYASVTIRAIAKAAKIPLPVLYYTYEDKRALYEACCAQSNITYEGNFSKVLFAVEDPMEIIYSFATVSCHSHLLFENTKLQFRFLLDRDHTIFTKMSVFMFASPSFARASAALETIGEGPRAKHKLLLIVSIAAGVVLHAPIWHEDIGQDTDPVLHDVDARKLVAEILALVMPEYDWAPIAERTFPKIRDLLPKRAAPQG